MNDEIQNLRSELDELKFIVYNHRHQQYDRTKPLADSSSTSSTTTLSGFYTPTVTGVTNVQSSTAFAAYYIRVGDNVVVGGRLEIDSSASGDVLLGLSLPIASTFTSSSDASGTLCGTGSVAFFGMVTADTSNARAQIDYYANSSSNQAARYIFMYKVA